jgi:hypothetical protein
MTKTLTGYCGLDCGECPAYVAYRTNDDELRAKMAKEWGSADSPVSPSDINCASCTSDGVRWTWCQQCAVRICAAERNVTTCAVCPDYGCERLEAFFSMAGEEARQKLEALRPTAADASPS